MTVQELIDRLLEIEDKSKVVVLDDYPYFSDIEVEEEENAILIS